MESDINIGGRSGGSFKNVCVNVSKLSLFFRQNVSISAIIPPPSPPSFDARYLSARLTTWFWAIMERVSTELL